MNEKKTIEYVCDKLFEKKVLRNQNPVMVVFELDHLGITYMMKPVIEKIAIEYMHRFSVLKYDSDGNSNIKKLYGLQESYTILLFNKGKVLMKVGAISLNEFREIIDKILEDKII